MSAKVKQKAQNGNVGKLTYSERVAAERLGISYITLFRKRKAGQVPFYRVGARILYDDACLTEFLQKNRRAAA